MYAKHFHLEEPPFSIAPNPRYLYLSSKHREAMAHLLYGIGVGGGFVVLTGEVVTGKTTLSRCLLDQLPEDVEIALIFNPRLNSRELLSAICGELRIDHPAKASLKQLIDQLNRHLLAAHALGRRTIVLIDEAQNLRFDVLEQIRLLTNLETNQAKLLQIILVGQPELNEVLERPHLRQLAQRITARYHLNPLDLAETGDYIRHRLAVAGCRELVFTPLAMRFIHRRSGGMPRLINLICDRALLGAYALGRHRVGWFVARRAARELLPEARSKGYARLGLATAGVLTLIAVSAVWFGMPSAWLGFVREEPVAAEATVTPQAETRVDVASAASSVALEQVVKAAIADAPQAAGVPALIPTSPAKPSFLRWIGGPDSSRQGGFAPLFTAWKLTPAAEADPCVSAVQQGFQCVPVHGSWMEVRSFNRPTAMEFALLDGSRHYATLLKIEGDAPKLAIGDSVPTVFELPEILPLWTGNAVLLWKPPIGGDWPIAIGGRSKAVAWVRERLGGAVESGSTEFFDADLKVRVAAFQAERGLTPDGVVGPLTFLYLAAKDGDRSAPRLESVSH